MALFSAQVAHIGTHPANTWVLLVALRALGMSVTLPLIPLIVSPLWGISLLALVIPVSFALVITRRSRTLCLIVILASRSSLRRWLLL